MDGQVIHIMNTNEVEGLADPSLQQYECSLYTEKGRIHLLKNAPVYRQVLFENRNETLRMVSPKQWLLS